MCTLIIGLDVVEPGSVALAANRDEDPARPSAGPALLLDAPPVVGGRDLRSGGTWLALRARRAAVAILNRRPRADDAPPAGAPRSRGLLALAVAAAPPVADAAADAALRALGAHPHAPCTVVWASPDGGWALAHEPPAAPVLRPLAPGWHVVTHADLDDRAEPRTAMLLDDLAGWAPRTPDALEAGLWARLRLHGDGAARPPVCIHDGPMPTVSASVVWLARGGARYLHVQGRPCEGAPADHSHLLADEPPAPDGGAHGGSR
uniref:NRDE family protein n=1 Tax=Eiseniibacteriota bacterium TaxID=2212470 RepID=A0A832I0N7_UNCEI